MTFSKAKDKLPVMKPHGANDTLILNACAKPP